MVRYEVKMFDLSSSIYVCPQIVFLCETRQPVILGLKVCKYYEIDR